MLWFIHCGAILTFMMMRTQKQSLKQKQLKHHWFYRNKKMQCSAYIFIFKTSKSMQFCSFIEGKRRVIYSILEYDPLLDSSNMTMEDWSRMAEDIKVFKSICPKYEQSASQHKYNIPEILQLV